VPSEKAIRALLRCSIVPAVMSSNVGRRWLVLCAYLLAFTLAACGGPTFIVQQFEGPQRPGETISTIRVNGDGPVRLLLLDGQDAAAPIDRDARLHIEVLPGPHTVIVANANAPGDRHPPVEWTAAAGKIYRVVFATDGGPHVFEVDRTSDALLGDVTAQPPRAERAKPAERPKSDDAATPSEDGK
jgi:hypothetical protein